MIKVEQIKMAVMTLSLPELTAFREWIDEFYAQKWDRQIENDLEAGRLDVLLAEVDKEYDKILS